MGIDDIERGPSEEASLLNSVGDATNRYGRVLAFAAVSGVSCSVLGALIGVVCGYYDAVYNSPCVDKPNSHAADKCAWGSGNLLWGALYGALIAGGASFFAALIYALKEALKGKSVNPLKGALPAAAFCAACGSSAS